MTEVEYAKHLVVIHRVFMTICKRYAAVHGPVSRGAAKCVDAIRREQAAISGLSEGTEWNLRLEMLENELAESFNSNGDAA